MSLEHLWAGWRHTYVERATEAERRGAPTDQGCVFCGLASSGPPSVENGVLWRGSYTFAVLNAYPYASGHLMVMPTRHVGSMGALKEEEATELWSGLRQAMAALEAAYEPDGLNMGANLGRAAGAGIPDHLHIHALPRWSGDTNFMTTVGDTRVMPESLEVAWEKITTHWPRSTD